MTREFEILSPKEARRRWASALLADANRETVDQAERSGQDIRVEYIWTPAGRTCLSMFCVLPDLPPEGHTEPQEDCKLCKGDN